MNSTPMIKISDKIYAKLETYQPTGSVKDRMVAYLVDHAYKTNQIMPGYTKFIEATSGNTGISLASQAAKHNCACQIIMPKNMSEQRKQMMRAFGADIIEVGDNDFKGAIALRDNIIKKSKHQEFWCPYQFSNKMNVECHYKTTAEEIYSQAAELGLNWSAFVHGAGTGGTMMGVKKYISEYNLDIKCVLTTPAESASMHGIQGINDGSDFLLDRKLMDFVSEVSTVDAINRMRIFAKETGLLVGISSGANILATERYLEKHDRKGVAVTILCDRGERYL